MAKDAPEPRFFASQKAFRAWLRKHHAALGVPCGNVH